MSKIKTIGILTSGGDSPGMNAAIRAVTRAGICNGFTIKGIYRVRAVTRAGICNGFTIKGIYRGYDGLIKDEVKMLTTEDVSGIITRGGTILKTARSKEFMTPEGMQKAYETCQKEEIDALVVIGGNGSLTGAWNFGVEFYRLRYDDEHHHGVCGPHPRYCQLSRAHLLCRGNGTRCRLPGSELCHRLRCRGRYRS